MSQKKSFVLYLDQYFPIQRLSLDQKGQLLEAMFQFHAGDITVFEDPVVEMAFAFFRQTFERDAEKYERKCRQNKENVTKRHSKASCEESISTDFPVQSGDFSKNAAHVVACGASGCVQPEQSEESKQTSDVDQAMRPCSETDGTVRSFTVVHGADRSHTAVTDSESDTESGSEREIPLKDPDGSFAGSVPASHSKNFLNVQTQQGAVSFEGKGAGASHGGERIAKTVQSFKKKHDCGLPQKKHAYGPPDCPHEQVCALYHELLPELPRAVTWGKNRRDLLRTRWRETWERLKKHNKEHDLPALLVWWKTYFLRVRASPFLMGRVVDRSGKAFFADLEWLVRPANYAKVIDGKYLERRPAP